MDLLTASSSGSNSQYVKISTDTGSGAPWSMFAKTKNGYETLSLFNNNETEIELGSIAFFYPSGTGFIHVDFSVANGTYVIYDADLYNEGITTSSTKYCYYASFFTDCSLILNAAGGSGGAV